MVLMLDQTEKLKIEKEIFEKEILNLKLSTFRPKAQFQTEFGDYIVRTAEGASDLAKIIQLRSHSFMADFTPDSNQDFIDFDHYDLLADHVLVLKKSTDELLGCYRIICSKFTNQCYSREQFNLGWFENVSDIKIELGRACIHKDHRNGASLNLVWKGLAQYAMTVNARYMYGCASVKTVSREVAYSIYWQLYPAFFKPEYQMSVLPRFQFHQATHQEKLLRWEDVEDQVPTLLKSYLQAGAKICSEPALDTFFQCVDFLTILDLHQIEAKYHRRYFKTNEA
jgi:putative hemolysin